jgi:hypothetical protein
MRIYWFLPIKKGNGKTFRASYRKPRDPFLPAERMLFVKFLLPRRDQEKEVLSQHIQVETEKLLRTENVSLSCVCLLALTNKEQKVDGSRKMFIKDVLSWGLKRVESLEFEKKRAFEV